MPHPISSADDITPTETRRGRAWIDQAAGVRIGYTLAGNSAGTSKTVVLIHGAPQTGYAWRKVVPTLVAAGYQVVVPDYRGAGASTKPRDGYDKWTMAGDLTTSSGMSSASTDRSR
jgi:pimeloyl-ACP methyl ester carboxylesterase